MKPRKHIYLVGYPGDRQVVYGKDDSLKRAMYAEPLTNSQAVKKLSEMASKGAVVFKLVELKAFGKSKGNQ